MSERNLLTHDGEEGTELTVQSKEQPENFHDAYVDDGGIVRMKETGAAFNENAYSVV